MAAAFETFLDAFSAVAGRCAVVGVAWRGARAPPCRRRAPPVTGATGFRRCYAAAVLIASCNGTLLVDNDGKLGIAERGGGWVGTALFVAVLLAVISIGSGVTLLATMGEVGALVPVGIGLVSAGIAVLLFKRWRRDRASTTFPAPWLVFDLPAGVVRDSAGAVLGKIGQVRVATEMQLASSSKMLVAYCPSKVVIARGTPFGDSVADFERALKSRGIGA